MKKLELKTLARQALYCSLGTVDKFLGKENNLVVYCYHNITPNPWVFNVQLPKFERQMAYLSTVGNFITLKDLSLYFDGKIKLPKKSFLITFDDGYKGITRTVETTKNFGISPVVFVLGNETKVDRKELKTKSELLGKEELLFLRGLGWEIGSHGLTHKKLTKLTKAEVQKEIRKSKTFIENKIESKITAFSYPHGRHTPEIVDEVRAQGFELGFSMDDGLITKSTNRFVIPRVGVMGNHSEAEFKYIASPSVLGFRKFVKKTFLAKYI